MITLFKAWVRDRENDPYSSNADNKTVFDTGHYKSIDTDIAEVLYNLAPSDQWYSITESEVVDETFSKKITNIFLDSELRYSDNPNWILKRVCDSLPPDNYFAFKVVTAENSKAKIKSRYPSGVFNLYYLIHFLCRRVIPKLIGIKKLVRILRIPIERSKAEIVGRLIYTGFQINQICEMGCGTLFIAQPDTSFNTNRSKIVPSEGILFSMKRVGKNNQPITVYKLRSMHPYAEYAQDYVLKNNGLEVSGKFKNDFRISTGGKLLRKYWIDELPMLYNLLKGDIKLIGVRPISEPYFALYPESVRSIRTRFKPGLIPPFYADMPQGFNQIVQSELKYLEAYEKQPYRTDLLYFFKIMKNIIFYKARSK